MKTDGAKYTGPKCDGDHAGDPCGDPECWQLDPCDQTHGGSACEDPHCYKREAHAAREIADAWKEPLERSDPDAYMAREA